MPTTKLSLVERQPLAADALDPDLDQALVGRLRSLAHAQRLRRHQRQELDGPACSLLVRSGLMTVRLAAAETRTTIVELLYPGDILSTAALQGLPGLSLCASLPSTCWTIPADILAGEIARDGALANYIIARRNLQQARMQLHVAVLAGLSSEPRVVAALIEAACHLGAPSNDAIRFDMPWSREDIADYLSLNADTLSRIMSRLMHGGVLRRTSRSHYVIRDWRALLAQCPLADAVIALHKPAWIAN